MGFILRPHILILFSIVPQIIFFLFYITLNFSPLKQSLFVGLLPIIYMAFTYFQWLAIAIVIAMKHNHAPVPIVMHLPHLFTFVPFIRLLNFSDHTHEIPPIPLLFTWIHAVVMHSFSLWAAWRWQLISDKIAYLRPIALLSILGFLIIFLTYAGLDLSLNNPSGLPLITAINGVLQFFIVVLFIKLQANSEGFLISWISLFAFTAINVLIASESTWVNQTSTAISLNQALACASLTQFFVLVIMTGQHKRKL